MAYDDFTQMRSYIVLAETLAPAERANEEPDVTDTVGDDTSAELALIDDLRALVFKLRAHMDPGEEGAAFDNGMNRAADMIENVIRRYTEND